MSSTVTASKLAEDLTGPTRLRLAVLVGAAGALVGPGEEQERLVRAVLAEDGLSTTQAAIRSAIRGLWRGVYTVFQFVDEMRTILERRLTQGWLEGAQECGIQPDELSTEEKKQLALLINTQLQFLPGLATDIVNGSRGSGDSLAQLLARVDLWARQYLTARNKGQAMACADQKAVWELGATEKHCPSCSKLAGKVKRMSFWAANVMPQGFPNPKLKCRGGHCDCRLRVTSLPLTRGSLPRLP